MKKEYYVRSLILVIALASMDVSAQVGNHFLDVTNVRPLVGATGNFFTNLSGTNSCFEVPRGSGNHSLYRFNLWIGGQDASGVLHLSGETYRQNTVDFTFGPAIPVQNLSFYNQVWKVSKSEIDHHIQHYQDPGYALAQAIEDWPGTGITNGGSAVDLAPFADVNLNGIYDPLNGDYPCIKGDQALYIIMNDNPPDSIGLPNSLGVEVHHMLYGYEVGTHSYLDEAIFLHTRIVNRSSKTYSDLRIGTWMDFDIGQ